MSEAKWNAVNQSEIADSLSFQAACAGKSPELWGDALVLVTLLDRYDMRLAVDLIENAGGLGYLLTMDQRLLESLGMSPQECQRFTALPYLAGVLLTYRARPDDPSTRRDVASEIAFRALGWDCTRMGIVGWDREGRRVADRVLAVGSTRVLGTALIQRALEAAITTRSVSVVIWTWVPNLHITISHQDRAFCDEIRMMASALRIGIEDCIYVSNSDAVSLAMLDLWNR